MSKFAFHTTMAITLLIIGRLPVAADPPNTDRQEVSATVLGDLGLAGLRPMGDRQGQSVRGRAFIGTPGNGPFTTLPAHEVIKGSPGVILHGTSKFGQTTTIVNHPQFGTITLPPTHISK